MSIVPLFPAFQNDLSVSYIGNAADGTNLSSYTFSGKSFGAADGDRYIIVGITANSSGAFSISSVTIGGVTATAIATATGAHTIAAIYIALVPSGATGDIVVNASTTIRSCGVSWYRAVGLSSATAYSTANDPSIASDAFSVTLNVPKGFLIAVCAGEDNATSRACTWTGVTEAFEVTVDTGPNLVGTGGSTTYANAATGQTITAQFDGGFDDGGLAVATWQ